MNMRLIIIAFAAVLLGCEKANHLSEKAEWEVTSSGCKRMDCYPVKIGKLFGIDNEVLADKKRFNKENNSHIYHLTLPEPIWGCSQMTVSLDDGWWSQKKGDEPLKLRSVELKRTLSEDIGDEGLEAAYQAACNGVASLLGVKVGEVKLESPEDFRKSKTNHPGWGMRSTTYFDLAEGQSVSVRAIDAIYTKRRNEYVVCSPAAIEIDFTYDSELFLRRVHGVTPECRGDRPKARKIITVGPDCSDLLSASLMNYKELQRKKLRQEAATVNVRLNDEDEKLKEALMAHRDPADDGGQAIMVETSSCAVFGKAAFGKAEDFEEYEPGNVIMPLAVAIAMEKGIVSAETMINAKLDDARYTNLPDDGPHLWTDEMSVSNGIVQSSNIVIGKVGANLGREELVRGLSAFGLTVSGTAPACRIAVGQGFRATSEQIAMAYAILFNHGVDNRIGESVISAATADKICAILAAVTIEQGTARRAAVKGVSVAGKNGTSLRFLNGKYAQMKFNATFVGCFENDGLQYIALFRYACGVCPHHQGGLRPAEAFADFVRKEQ